MKRVGLVLLVLAVYVLHQDFWNWKETTLVGFLPIGLAYHAGYSVLCAIMMFVLVKFAWPEHLEVEESQPSDVARQHQPQHQHQEGH